MKNYESYLNKKTQATDLISALMANGMTISLPIDIEGILKKLNIDFGISPNFKKIKVTGSIEIKDGSPYIWINPMKNTTAERRRFTIAHELGHFMLHVAPLGNNSFFEDLDISFNRDDNWDYKEMEANAFAAQILMPTQLLEKELKSILSAEEYPTKELVVEKLAKTFNVSFAAMEFRLKKLGVEL